MIAVKVAPSRRCDCSSPPVTQFPWQMSGGEMVVSRGAHHKVGVHGPQEVWGFVALERGALFPKPLYAALSSSRLGWVRA